ncbi:MAG: hypothetical protein NWE89_05575 [Candidatus Bathyarchaeota archaeon]|nr:hypothetical protein [Candidatus Bathyarchaeota archaeon]
MIDHPLSKIIKGFDLDSYHAGINTAFAEVVGAGCKKLALSSTYSSEQAERMLEPTRHAAEEYGAKLYVETDLLVSKLFPRDIAKGKTVILIAQSQDVLDEYMELKRLKEESNRKKNPEDLELEIARKFGALLSYSKEKIDELLAKHG